MVRPLSAFFFLVLGVRNALAGGEPLKKRVVGLGEACDAAAGIVCESAHTPATSGLDPLHSRPDFAEAGSLAARSPTQVAVELAQSEMMQAP